MKYIVAIRYANESRPFWTREHATLSEAERVAKKNQRLIDRMRWNHIVEIVAEEDPCPK